MAFPWQIFGRGSIGIDVGGTKIAGGIVLPEGIVLARRQQPTWPDRGGEAVLADVVAFAHELIEESRVQEIKPVTIGIGVAELVNPDGQVLSEATIRWKGLPIMERIRAETGFPVHLDADVRAGAIGEAMLGAGRGLGSFLYVTVGTGISAALVIEGRPYTGSRGLTGTFASSRRLIPDDNGRLIAGPPLEQFASGPALASRFAENRPEFTGTAVDILVLADCGDEVARTVVTSAGSALGAAIAELVNLLDPEAVVLGGGLGLAEGLYLTSTERALRQHVWSDLHRGVPLVPAQLGNDAVWIGAALRFHNIEELLTS